PVAAFARAPAQRPAPSRPAAPAQQPAAPAQPGAAAATGPTVVQVKPEPSQSSWTKVCGKDQGANKEICYTTRDFVSDQGQPVLAVAIYDVKG
ncbi:invasion associated locus B family protein, partial [Mesorhizobium sp. M2D.F.Ca.ET.223.01.1.1]